MARLTDLWELAGSQHGYVTTADALAYGVTGTALVKAADRRRLERTAYGVYRFPEFPHEAIDAYVLATLWPAKRGVLSHETALQIHELCDIEPERIHITVPRSYRIRRRGGEAYTVHHEDLDDPDLTWFEGVRIVTPAKAIRQAIASAVAPHLVAVAIANARKRGRIAPDLAAELDGLLRRADV
jgi:predicted transcriptional regulator of viral defense system